MSYLAKKTSQYTGEQSLFAPLDLPIESEPSPFKSSLRFCKRISLESDKTFGDIIIDDLCKEFALSSTRRLNKSLIRSIQEDADTNTDEEVEEFDCVFLRMEVKRLLKFGKNVDIFIPKNIMVTLGDHLYEQTWFTKNPDTEKSLLFGWFEGGRVFTDLCYGEMDCFLEDNLVYLSVDTEQNYMVHGYSAGENQDRLIDCTPYDKGSYPVLLFTFNDKTSIERIPTKRPNIVKRYSLKKDVASER